MYRAISCNHADSTCCVRRCHTSFFTCRITEIQFFSEWDTKPGAWVVGVLSPHGYAFLGCKPLAQEGHICPCGLVQVMNLSNADLVFKRTLKPWISFYWLLKVTSDVTPVPSAMQRNETAHSYITAAVVRELWTNSIQLHPFTFYFSVSKFDYLWEKQLATRNIPYRMYQSQFFQSALTLHLFKRL